MDKGMTEREEMYPLLLKRDGYGRIGEYLEDLQRELATHESMYLELQRLRERTGAILASMRQLSMENYRLQEENRRLLEENGRLKEGKC